jgi:hypothetical protein
MKSFHKFAPLAILMAAAETSASTGGAAADAAPTGAVPESNTADAAPKATRAPKDPAKILDIINGRMPLPLVYCIRFKEGAAAKAAELAKKYGTSVGKVFDIRKGSNFGYITEAYKPSVEELKAARDFITTGTSTKGKTLAELGGNPTEIEAHLAGLTVATPEEVAARGWVIKAVGEAKPVDPNAPPAAVKAPKAPKAAKAAPAAPVAGANAAMF